MNGRIYDGLLGRFLSADLVVSNPGDLQAFNRFSYVMNRPLTLTDPSGFIPEWLQKTWQWGHDRATEVVHFGGGVIGGIGQANGVSPETPTGDDRAAAAGLVVGNVIGMIQGGVEIAAGIAGDLGAGAAEVLSVGTATPIAVPAAVVSTAVIVHGGAVAVNGGRHAMDNISKLFNSAERRVDDAKIKPTETKGQVSEKPATTAGETSGGGGRKGSPETRAQNQGIADEAKASGGSHEAGAGLPEQRFPDPAQPGTTKGSRYADVTVKDADGNVTHVQTVDTTANGAPTDREIEAAIDIWERSGDAVRLVPKTP